MLIYATYSKPLPEGAEWRAKAAAWSSALRDFGCGEIKSLVEEELAKRKNPFMPVPADIMRRASGEEEVEWTDEDGTKHRERAVVANAPAYQPWQPNTRALPEAEGEGRAEWRELREKLRPRRIARAKDTRPKPIGESGLLGALCAYTNMEPWLLPREVWTEFGWWFLARYSVDDWTPELGREQWFQWQQEKQAEAAPAEATQV